MSSKLDRTSGRHRDRSREHRSRRHRSPSYDSYDSDSDSYSSSRASSPAPRQSRRRREVHSDNEDKYGRGRNRERRGRDYYNDEPSPSPTRRSVVEDLLAAVGLIHAKNKKGASDRGFSRQDRGDRGDLEEKRKAQRQALQAALTAAAVEAFRTRHEPGGFTAQKLMRIASAAIAAGGIDAVVDRNPNSHSMRHIVESVVAGLAAGNTVGRQVKHNRPGSVKEKMGGGVIGMAAKQLLSRSLSRPGSKRKSRRD